MQSNGLATVLLMIPVVAVPALAIFGIPQFAPVVASPLDEGQDNDRESKVGNSERPVHDELFGDLDGFPSSNSSNENNGRRDSFSGNRSKRKLSSKSVRETAASDWDSDFQTESDWPSNARRRSSGSEAPQAEPDPAPPRSRKRNLVSERSGRADRRAANVPRNDEEIRLAAAVEEEQPVAQSNLVDEVDEPRRPKNGFGNAIPAEPRGQKEDRRRPRETVASEPLTWKTAVERLNELEIRNFRLEPGHQNGQFIFICSYTAPDTPRVSYRFEAGADEPLKAVEKVLDQIAEWQQRR